MRRTYGTQDAPPVALVTGGARGIGRACATALADEGVSVTVVDRDEGGAFVTAEAIRGTGGRSSYARVRGGR